MGYGHGKCQINVSVLPLDYSYAHASQCLQRVSSRTVQMKDPSRKAKWRNKEDVFHIYNINKSRSFIDRMTRKIVACYFRM